VQLGGWNWGRRHARKRGAAGSETRGTAAAGQRQEGTRGRKAISRVQVVAPPQARRRRWATSRHRVGDRRCRGAESGSFFFFFLSSGGSCSGTPVGAEPRFRPDRPAPEKNKGQAESGQPEADPGGRPGLPLQAARKTAKTACP